MDIEKIKDSIVTNVYHIDASKKVPLHKHNNSDELFYYVYSFLIPVAKEAD